MQLKVHSDIFISIDHATLTDKLTDLYGTSGQPQIWFSSYLQNRHQSVKNKDTPAYQIKLQSQM